MLDLAAGFASSFNPRSSFHLYGSLIPIVTVYRLQVTRIAAQNFPAIFFSRWNPQNVAYVTGDAACLYRHQTFLAWHSNSWIIAEYARGNEKADVTRWFRVSEITKPSQNTVKLICPVAVCTQIEFYSSIWILQYNFSVIWCCLLHFMYLSSVFIWFSFVGKKILTIKYSW